MSGVLVSEPFHELSTRQVRILSEAARLGPVTFYLWSDQMIEKVTGKAPKFPLVERRYFWESCKYISRVVDVDGVEPGGDFSVRVVDEASAALQQHRDWFDAHPYVQKKSFDEVVLKTFPKPDQCPMNPQSGRKKVIVTGCFDFFHTGHVRFFEEVNELGDLYVCVGHDENIRLLKGEGHPLFPQDERAFIAGSMKFAKQSLVTSGNGWLDAEPEIERLKPDIYAVNEDGDKPAKKQYCENHGIQYVVLKRLPKPGLTRRTSTDLRGF